MPERWLGDDGAGEGGSSEGGPTRRPDRHWAPFSKGTRACLGMNLAVAEIYLALASVFRRFEMELWETRRERDVDVLHDFVNPSPGLNSVGVRVLVKGVKG